MAPAFPQVYENSEEEMKSILLSRFEQVAGGYYVNELCEFLTVDEKNDYVGKVAQLNILAQKQFGSKMIIMSQKRGRMGAARKPYSECKDTSKEFFDASQILVDDLYNRLIRDAT